jgi:hypothetical protein
MASIAFDAALSNLVRTTAQDRDGLVELASIGAALDLQSLCDNVLRELHQQLEASRKAAELGLDATSSYLRHLAAVREAAEEAEALDAESKPMFTSVYHDCLFVN